MNDIPIRALLTFMFITTFTPGPNNIASASSGILYGYRKSLPFLSGIFSAFFISMLGSGLLSAKLSEVLPNFEAIIRIVGAIYILWLAYHTFMASYDFDVENDDAGSFRQGFLLSILNPKVVVYGMSVHGAFLNPIANDLLLVILASFVLASVAFIATTAWALFGAGIRQWLRNPIAQRWLNATLALLLVYTAIEISGLFG